MKTIIGIISLLLTFLALIMFYDGFFEEEHYAYVIGLSIIFQAIGLML